MEQRVGPLAALRQFGERAPSLLEQLPRLPELILNANKSLERLDKLAHEQRLATERLAGMMESQQRRSRRGRWVGGALIVGGGALLFSPVVAALQSNSVTAGLIAAVLGSLLIARS